MRRSMFMRLTAAGAAAALSLGVAACGDDDEDDGGDGGDATGAQNVCDTVAGSELSGSGEITIGYLDWDEAVVTTELWKQVLEEQGYTVNTEQIDIGLIYQGMADGDIDFFLDTWASIHQDYISQYEGDLEELGAWYDTTSLAITVPSYVEEINSLEDLADNADMFGGEIIGIDAGAGLTQTTEEAVIPDYGLEDSMELVTSSTSSMLAALDGAYANQEPIVVTLWHPHWAYAAYDLKDLEDPQGSLGGNDPILTYGRGGLSEDQPGVASRLCDFHMDDEQLSSLEDMAFNEASEYHDDVPGAVAAWREQNADFVDGMINGM